MTRQKILILTNDGIFSQFNMPKYYVKSGDLKYIIDCTDHKSAILAALYHFKGRQIMTGPKICISETGFINIKTWKCYDTQNYIKDI